MCSNALSIQYNGIGILYKSASYKPQLSPVFSLQTILINAYLLYLENNDD